MQEEAACVMEGWVFVFCYGVRLSKHTMGTIHDTKDKIKPVLRLLHL